jgi:flagellar hook-associated protein 1
MSDASMSIGLSGLFAAQTALDVAGQNIANSTTPGYARREVRLSETASGSANNGLGMGVSAETIVRNRDMYLEGQVQSYSAGLSAATTQSQFLDQIQALLQEPNSGQGISTQIDAFFNDWQAVAANPEDSTARSTLLDAGQQLAQSLQQLRSGLLGVQNFIGLEISDCVSQANQLTAELAQSNQLTLNASGAAGAPLSLEDQRDALMEQLAELTGASNTTPRQSTAQVQVGGAVLVTGSTSLTLNAPQSVGAPVTVGNGSQSSPVSMTTGTMGALLQLSQTTIPEYIRQIDNFTLGLISMVNEQHAEGISQNGPFTALTGSNSVKDASVTLAQSGLSVTPTQGQLTINVVDNTTGAQTAVAISVNPASASLNDLATAISGAGHLTATVSGGKLSISAASGYSFDFAANQGTNILASLGMNPFFQGTNASDIHVADTLVNNPAALAAGRSADSGDGSNATAISNLENMPSAAFGGNTMAQTWQTIVSGIGIDTSNATQAQQSAQSMVDTLTAQEQAISGVSLDEEAAKILQYQQLYEASARYMSTIGKLTQTLLQYIG